jgi:hypothetical protein
MWHGDYHTNYNIQQPFWGFHASNHPELVEPFFEIMDHFHYLGSKIARDYCGTRGCFIQLSSYPMTMEHDPIPTSPMSRMPYMTGWVPELFWRHFLYTNDIEFLKSRAYPFIRDCALFYTDFLSLGKDGLYHAFPSCWGEEGFDGDVDTSTDALQTIEYAASCLSMALQAAEVLGIDPDLQKAWKERISKLAPGRGENEWRPLPEANDNRHRQFNVPAFRPGENYRFPNRWPFAKRWWGWIDKLVISLIRDVRNGRFNESDYHDLLKVIHRWRHPNGLLWAMPERFYGSCGGWFEILGIIMPLQEMMLQSWDGVIRIFPVWVGETIAQFENLRAEGAFLVSAGYNNGITYVRIESLSGTACVLLNPWPSKKVKVVDSNTKKTIIEADTDILKFDTQPGSKYQLMCN